jgi:alkylation response protein AidB-like acyl-CoA dehydrogenase
VLVSDLAGRIRRLHSAGALTLPFPGRGRTAERHLALMNLGRTDLSAARLAEAHTDAIAILAEHDRGPQVGGIYGVWASDGPQSRLTAVPEGSGWCISGIKQYCSGAGLIDAALVTAHCRQGVRLFEMPLSVPGISMLESQWVSPGFADTATGPVRFDEVRVPLAAAVGGPGWYLDRPGFWHGAMGPAACWAGGALGLIDAAISLNRKDPHSRAQAGALMAIAWGLEAVVVKAGEEIDEDPADRYRAGKRALKVRHLVERWCTEVLDRFGQATGPQLLAHDLHVVRQHAALALYIRQCHGARDLEFLATS